MDKIDESLKKYLSYISRVEGIVRILFEGKMVSRVDEFYTVRIEISPEHKKYCHIIFSYYRESKMVIEAFAMEGYGIKRNMVYDGKPDLDEDRLKWLLENRESIGLAYYQNAGK